MALEKSLWLPHIEEGLFPDNSFVSKSVNLSGFVNGRTVNVPNAGAPPNVEKNRTTFPAQVKSRKDANLEFNIDEYTTDPIRISNKEKIELSYDKRQSVIRLSKSKLIDTVAADVLLKWMRGAPHLLTTGEAVPTHIAGTDGERKKLTRKDVLNTATEFNKNNIPSENRYMLLDAVMYSQLLEDLTEADKALLSSTADASKGVIGQLFTFNIMMRSHVAITTGGDVRDSGDGAPVAPSDGAGAFAWHTESVAVAQGDVSMFDLEGDPTFYGDIFSFLVRAGGSRMRNDNKGVYILSQDRA